MKVSVSVTSASQFLSISFSSHIIFFLSSPLLVSRPEIFRTPDRSHLTLFKGIPPRFSTAISALLLACSLIASLFTILSTPVFLTLNNSFTLSYIIFLAFYNVLPIVRSRFLSFIPDSGSASSVILSFISLLYAMLFLPINFWFTIAVCTTAPLP